MSQVFLATLSPMLMMFACMVIGFVLNKKKICPDNTVTVLMAYTAPADSTVAPSADATVAA